MKIKSLKVVAATTDISNLIQGMTLYESINGFLKGSINILDGTNFYDEVIGDRDALIPLKVTFVYGIANSHVEIPHHFMMDGITDMKITKTEKTYNIHLIGPVEHALKLTKLTNVYQGTSHSIIRKIFYECMPDGTRLHALSNTVTNGKYIVPNLPAIQAIFNVANHAIDNSGAGYYLWQRVWDSGGTRFGSVKWISEDWYMDPDGNKFVIRSNLASSNCMTHPTNNWESVGVASKFTVQSYKMAHTDRLASGIYGNSINQIELDKTKLTKNNPVEYSSQEITTLKTSKLFYENNNIAPVGAAHIAVPKRFIGLRAADVNQYNREYWARGTDADRLKYIGTPDGDGALANAIKEMDGDQKHNRNFGKHHAKAKLDFEAEIKRIEAGIPVQDAWNAKSLFEDISNPTNMASLNMKKRIYNQSLYVEDMVPVPGMGCGHSVMVEQGGSQKSKSGADGGYIIANINHFFQPNDTEIDYTQNLTLIRERA
jgi:hypothetical protein